ncbi:BLUF domain-containing protein [Phenylobacterium sp. J367]|uniref:BLUF domain-containing protein n=1 Tax=Phenylobacterium sp. J367 TaxID=2898435 RepID=UPI002150BAE1|nr:BLUF domain-containing protein [Phenylobacterium sp. J367]MCR5878299.1 BLUF domain-containing protein [Phenylobacterium sp. J367]
MSRGSRTLHQLIYASRVRVPWPDQQREVDGIVQASIRNNRVVDVTGLLLVHDGWFVQALEGPVEAVLGVYGRICDDGRHEDCRVLYAGPAEARSFEDWNMCARHMTPADEAILDTLSMKTVFEPHRLTAKQALRLLKAVRGVQQSTQLRALG